jgi:hypothetical protein
MLSTRPAIASSLVAVVMIAFNACGSDDQSLADRQQAVAEAGAEVMSGLSTLKERFDEISVELIETDAGATIRYETNDAEAVQAIHDWFAAQSIDHDEHGSM